MKRLNGHIFLGFGMIVLSALLYYVYYRLFHENATMVVFLFESAVFLPIQVLFVTLIIDQLLYDREKKGMLKKMNMVIGVFFSEVGTKLLKSFSELIRVGDLRRDLIIGKGWSDRDFLRIRRRAQGHDYQITVDKEKLDFLRSFLIAKRDFLTGLLENANLLEHDTFTDLLWAVFHLMEELSFCADVRGLPETDCAHLAGDVKRAYSLLVLEWLAYMKHLKSDYPYLFSLAIRTNPFDPDARPEVK